MKDISDKSIDLIIADMPYNIGKDKDWDKWKKQEDYVQYIGERFLQCQRVLKDNGSFYWFHNDFLQIVKLQNWISKNTEFVFKQFISWNKRFEGVRNKGFLDGFVETNMLRNYQKMAEYILFYTFQDETGLEQILPLCFKPYLDYMTEQKKLSGLSIKDCNNITGYIGIASHWFYPYGQHQPRFIQKNDYQKLQTTEYFQKPYEDLRREYEDLRYTFNNQKTHHSIWNYEIASGDNHITPKPVPLIENIILHSSNEGDTILDPFAGSGTTAISCIKTNRDYILIEKEQKYIDIINKRIQDEMAQLKIDF